MNARRVFTVAAWVTALAWGCGIEEHHPSVSDAGNGSDETGGSAGKGGAGGSSGASAGTAGKSGSGGSGGTPGSSGEGGSDTGAVSGNGGAPEASVGVWDESNWDDGSVVWGP